MGCMGLRYYYIFCQFLNFFFLQLEHNMLTQEVSMAVYFAQDNPELSTVFKAIKSRTSSTAKSAAASKT